MVVRDNDPKGRAGAQTQPNYTACLFPPERSFITQTPAQSKPERKNTHAINSQVLSLGAFEAPSGGVYYEPFKCQTDVL